MMDNNNSSGHTPVARREVVKVLPTRRAPAPAEAQQRQPFRVLQTSHAPAQLSLFLRPASFR